MQTLLDEYHQADVGWIEAIVAQLQLLLIKAQRKQQQLRPNQPRSSGHILTARFQQLVKAHATQAHELSYYANQLGVTVGHLSETTKDTVGVSAGRLIRQQLLLEAKRLLAHSELTAAQVAEQLHFVDASYFGRFFKRETGQTPRQFRNSFYSN